MVTPLKSKFISLPQSYTTYASQTFKDVKLSHHPASSPIATPIIILTIHRPSANGAFTNDMGDEMASALRMFDVDDRVKVIIVTGQGRFFCPGADLNMGFGSGPTGGKEKITESRDGGGRLTMAIHQCRKPVIAAMNGSAVGIGVTMTLPMAIRITCKQAKMGLVFARRGLVMEAASSFFLPRLIGHSRAMHLVTTGAVYPADDKLLEGLFSEVLDSPDAVLPRALEIAEEIARNTSSVSWALMRDMMYRGMPTAEETHLLDSKLIFELFGSKDNNEGVKSFLEKREPKFTGNMYDDAPQSYPWFNLHETVYRARGKVDDSKL